MGPRNLQSKIHSDYSAESANWSEYRGLIKDLYDASIAKADFNDHLIREFNRRINRLNLSSDLQIAPFDSGFRFTGTSITSASDPSAQAYVDAITAAGATVTSAQFSAIEAFIVEEKAASRWDLHKRIYLPIWGLAAANAICMKSLTSGTFVSTIDYLSGGIASIDGYMDLNANFADLGISFNSYHFAVLYPLLSNNENFEAPFGTIADAYFLYSDGSFSASIGNVSINSFGFELQPLGILSMGGNQNSRYVKRRNSTGVDVQNNSQTITTSPSSDNLYFLARNNYGSSADATCQEIIGAFTISSEMTSSQDTSYTQNLKVLWETSTSLTLF